MVGGSFWQALWQANTRLRLVLVNVNCSGSDDARLGRELEFTILTVCDSHCSRFLLLLAGDDVERNPGPISKGKMLS